MVEVTIDETGVSTQIIPLKPQKDLVKVVGKYEDVLHYPNNENGFVAVELLDKQVIGHAYDFLKEKYPYLLQITYQSLEKLKTNQTASSLDVEKQSPIEIFKEFYEKMKGEAMSQESEEIIQQLLEEVSEDDAISLTLSAFGPYPDTITIDFESFQEDGLFLITGPTGSGKTMIFDAMIFALYGKTSGQIRQTDSLRCDHALNEIPTFVEFSFSLHQQNYTIKRNPKYYLEGKKTPKQPSALLILPDGKMVEGIKEVNQKMISLLGVDDQQFKQICMIAQGEFTKLIMASSDEREKVLRELFHSETYQKLEEKLKVHLKTYQDKYDLLLNKRKDLMQELQVEDHQEYLSKQTKLIAKSTKRI